MKHEEPLWWAAMQGHPDIVGELIAAGANLYTQHAHYGLSSLLDQFSNLQDELKRNRIKSARRLAIAGVDFTDLHEDQLKLLKLDRSDIRKAALTRLL